MVRLRRALDFARPHRGAAAAVVAVTLIGAALGAAEPLILKVIFDALAAGGPARQALLGVAALAAAGLAREVSNAFGNWLMWRTRLRVHYALLQATVDRLHRLPFEYTRKEGVGAVMTRLDRGIHGFVGALGELLFNLVPSVAYLVLAVVTMLRLDWRLTLVVLAVTPVPAVIAALAAPTQVRREQDLLDRWAAIYGRFNEVLAGLITVRSFAMEDDEKQRFLSRVASANDVVVRGVRFDSAVSALQNAFATIGRVAAVGVGVVLVLGEGGGGVSLGTIVAFLGYVGGLFGPVQSMTGMYRVLRTASVSMDVVFSILDAQEHIGDAPDARDPGRLRGRIELVDVSFRYRPEDPYLLDRISLTIEPGEHLAIVGPSGSGKTTLTTLVQRFYDPQEGSVRIDGRDVRELKQSALRRQIGVVLQDAVLFNDTMRNNIAYGTPGASEAAILAAVRAAGLEKVVARLPRGLDTVLGERGGTLSVGERQRVGIARALLKDPPVIILDEATSALDAATEALVQEALASLLQGRTAIIIAHRLSTVVGADRIVVLHDGTIVEEGPHRDLMARGGYYAWLVRQQTRGLLPVDHAR